MTTENEPPFGDEIASSLPPNTFQLTSGFPMADQVWILLPNKGTLWVQFGGPVKAWIWHQGGAMTPVEAGTKKYQVEAGNALVYQLSELPHEMSLSWAYV